LLQVLAQVVTFFLIVGVLAGCEERDERKVRYVTLYVSQDVEIKEVLTDLDMKKPGVVVVHPEGVDVKHHPTKPRKTLSFAPSTKDMIALLLFIIALTTSYRLLLTNNKKLFFQR